MSAAARRRAARGRPRRSAGPTARTAAAAAPAAQRRRGRVVVVVAAAAERAVGLLELLRGTRKRWLEPLAPPTRRASATRAVQLGGADGLAIEPEHAEVVVVERAVRRELAVAEHAQAVLLRGPAERRTAAFGEVQVDDDRHRSQPVVAAKRPRGPRRRERIH